VTGIELDLMLASILAGAEPGIRDRGSISFHLHVKSFHIMIFSLNRLALEPTSLKKL
jgi:hypothetical protein